MAFGLILHKFAAALALGSTLGQTGYSDWSAFLFLLVFAIVMPIGLVVGLSLTSVNPLIDSIAMSLSGGTFIYISCTTLIKREFDKDYRKWLQFLLVLVGGLLIAVLWFLEAAHSHGESHDDHDDHAHAESAHVDHDTSHSGHDHL